MIVSPDDDKRTRIGSKLLPDGRKARIGRAAASAGQVSATKAVPRIKESYQKQVVPRSHQGAELPERHGRPLRLTKVVGHMEWARHPEHQAARTRRAWRSSAASPATPATRRRQKSIAPSACARACHRAGDPARDRMYEFVDRLFNVALPRVRELPRVPRTPSTAGNYTLGLKDQIISPRSLRKVDKLRG